VEIDVHGKTCWQIDGLVSPVDAQVLSGGRVVIVEGIGRVSERDIKGTVRWLKSMNNPLTCQRLDNGNTFLVGRQQLLEVDPEGKEVFTYHRQTPEILAARKLPDGQIALLTTSQTLVRLDAAGKEVRSTRLNNLQLGGLMEVLPDGGLLLPQSYMNKVIECDGEGKFVTEYAVQNPNSAVRLANGNTLVAGQSQSRVVELDRDGNVVWEYKDNIRATRARRR
jgi:hypothetical protein